MWTSLGWTIPNKSCVNRQHPNFNLACWTWVGRLGYSKRKKAIPVMFILSKKRINTYLVLRKKHFFCVYNSVNAVSTIQQWSGLCFKVFCVTELGDREVSTVIRHFTIKWLLTWKLKLPLVFQKDFKGFYQNAQFCFLNNFVYI